MAYLVCALALVVGCWLLVVGPQGSRPGAFYGRVVGLISKTTAVNKSTVWFADE